MSERIDIEAAEWPCCETGEPCPRHYWLTDVSGKEVGPFLRPTAPPAPETQTAPEAGEFHARVVTTGTAQKTYVYGPDALEHIATLEKAAQGLLDALAEQPLSPNAVRDPAVAALRVALSGERPATKACPHCEAKIPRVSGNHFVAVGNPDAEPWTTPCSEWERPAPKEVKP